MFKSITTGGGSNRYYRDYPQECPVCHKNITPIFLHEHCKRSNIPNNITITGYLFLQCPNPNCASCYTAEYKQASTADNNYIFSRLAINNVKKKPFSEIILSISNSFIIIYNQAFHAEQSGLIEISGVGYRKALEFLIKDYIIQLDPTQKEGIEKKLLGQCIAENIDHPQIKEVAKRAVWLGNDETHYVRKWEGKTLSDLKTLIELTTRWIEMEQMTKKYKDDMSS